MIIASFQNSDYGKERAKQSLNLQFSFAALILFIHWFGIAPFDAGRGGPGWQWAAWILVTGNIVLSVWASLGAYSGQRFKHVAALPLLR